MGPLLRQWSDDVIVVDPDEVTRFVSTDGRLTHIELDRRRVDRARRAVLQRRHAARASTSPSQLGCALTEDGFVEAAPGDRQTSVDGVYAVGNCADPMLNVPMSIADGARAGVFVNVRLLEPASIQELAAAVDDERLAGDERARVGGAGRARRRRCRSAARRA